MNIFNILLIGCFLLPRLLFSQGIIQHPADSVLIENLRDARKKILKDVSQQSPYGQGSYDYTLYTHAYEEGRAVLYGRVKSASKFVKLSLAQQRGGKFEFHLFMFADEAKRIRFVRDKPVFQKNAWSVDVFYYFDEEEKLFAIEKTGLIELSFDHFDEAVEIVFYDKNSNILATDFDCYGASQTCTGFKDVPVRIFYSLPELLKSKGVDR